MKQIHKLWSTGAHSSKSHGYLLRDRPEAQRRQQQTSRDCKHTTAVFTYFIYSQAEGTQARSPRLTHICLSFLPRHTVTAPTNAGRSVGADCRFYFIRKTTIPKNMEMSKNKTKSSAGKRSPPPHPPRANAAGASNHGHSGTTALARCPLLAKFPSRKL